MLSCEIHDESQVGSEGQVMKIDGLAGQSANARYTSAECVSECDTRARTA